REEIKKNIDAVVEVIETGKVSASSDIGRGGILSTLAHMCSRCGARVDLTDVLINENELFSETSGRAILTVNHRDLVSISTLLETQDIPFTSIGTVGGDSLSIIVGDNSLTLPLETIKHSLNILNESMIS
ncbi:MAG: hypothetical protein LUQ34_01765, partial [Euryarchaeota archaeon]|nr:hypothetical protein [Euryarchaeota archaeon]